MPVKKHYNSCFPGGAARCPDHSDQAYCLHKVCQPGTKIKDATALGELQSEEFCWGKLSMYSAFSGCLNWLCDSDRKKIYHDKISLHIILYEQVYSQCFMNTSLGLSISRLYLSLKYNLIIWFELVLVQNKLALC